MLDQATFSLPVKGTNLLLRPVRISDAANRLNRCADPLNVAFLPHLQGKASQSVADVEKWIESVRAGWNKDSLFLVVVDTTTDTVIGEGPLGPVNWHKNVAESGIMLDHQRTGQGIATKALNTTMDFAFTELGLQEIMYRTFQTNLGMAKVLKDKLRVKGQAEEGLTKDGAKEYKFVFKREPWLAAMSQAT